MAGDEERRDYFRIADEVYLQHRLLSEAEYQEIAARPEQEWEATCSLVTQVRAISSQASGILSSIRKHDPEIAQYLGLIDRKIDLLAQMVAGSGDAPDAPNTRVDLSAGGMGFTREEPAALGSKIEVELLLFPSRVCVHGYGEVVHCTPETDGYSIGLDFTLMSEMEREALIRHVLARQSEALRRRRDEQR